MDSAAPASPEESRPPSETTPAPDSPPAAAAPDELPEWEPLSPELLEDEAIRGDFVLRWAVVGLALLVGLSQITEIRTMVHVRTGNWLMSHGVLPPRHDPFSLTASDRTWVNLSWLFDIVAATIHRVSGAIGLSVVQGLLAVAVFALLVHTTRIGIRTWWGSICATLALLAAYPRFTMQPELVTLLGLAATLYLLIRAEQENPQRSLWMLPAIFWVWAQFDPRAYVGWSLALAYGLGTLIDQRRTDPSAWSPVMGRALWMPLGIGLAVLVVHPFLWETWLAPLRMYGVEYPALQEAFPRPGATDSIWYPIWSKVVWERWDHRNISAAVLAVATLICLLLDRKRVPWAHGLLFVAANALACFATHEMAAAALVNCVLATVHAQAWYKERFGQVYSIATPEVLFSRGGRAITVMALFGFAWLAISGRLDSVDGKRTGVGLDRHLAQEIDSFRKLAESTYDDRGFHFTLRQGDALIAAGRNSFVDSRVQLFAGEGDQNLIGLHDRVRTALRRERPDVPGSGDAKVWQPAFETYRISHVLPRLTIGISGPDYRTLFDLLLTPDWSLTAIAPGSAVLHRMQGPDPKLQEFLKGHYWDPFNEAFRAATPTREQPHDWAQPPTLTETIFSLPRRRMAGPTVLASHYGRLASNIPGAPATFRLACLLLAIREAQAGVLETPALPEAHRILGETYALLGQIEGAILSETGVNWSSAIRYFQACAALRQATQLDPDDISSWSMLLELYQSAGRMDLALETVQALVRLKPLSDNPTDTELRSREFLLETETRLLEAVGKLQTHGKERIEKGDNRLEVAAELAQAGGILEASQILEADAIAVEQNPFARLLLTQWLLERGSGRAAEDSAARLQAVGDSTGTPNWRDNVAYAALARGDYTAAISLWQSQARDSDLNQLQATMFTLPMSTASPVWLGEMAYPVSHLVSFRDGLSRSSYSATLTDLQTAFAELERGNLPGVKAPLERALQRSPDSPLRPLLRLYWFGLTDEALDPEPPGDWIPISAETFAADS